MHVCPSVQVYVCVCVIGCMIEIHPHSLSRKSLALQVTTDWVRVAAAAHRIPIRAILPVKGVSPPDPSWPPDYPSDEVCLKVSPHTHVTIVISNCANVCCTFKSANCLRYYRALWQHIIIYVHVHIHCIPFLNMKRARIQCGWLPLHCFSGISQRCRHAQKRGRGSVCIYTFEEYLSAVLCVLR